MSMLFFALAVCAFLIGVYFVIKRSWEDVQEHDHPDTYGADEGDMRTLSIVERRRF